MTSKDRRIKRTRMYLEESLLRLMEEKSIKHITVKELTESANINRSTFYLHYSDINDVMKHIQQNLLQGFYEELAVNESERTVEEDVSYFMEVVIRYLQQNRRTLLIMCGKNGDRSFIDTLAGVTLRQAHMWFKSLLGENADPKNLELAETFFCNGCVAVLDKWLLNDEIMRPKDVHQLLFRLVLNGAHGFVGN